MTLMLEIDESNLFYVEAGGEERNERPGKEGKNNNSIAKTTG